MQLESICVYPSRTYLENTVDRSSYSMVPFTLRLALGEPQLSFLAFDLSVLEIYRNDPRYYYSNDDISGSISISGSYYEDEAVPESDKVLLQSFGFAYTSELNRAVAVFLRYLDDLSPQHQQIWRAKLLDGDYKLHPGYFSSSILGNWHQGISIFQAFLEEIEHINNMCSLMGWPSLFRTQI